MPSPHRQGGVALIVALVLLVAITLLGLSSMRSTGLQERMTANLYDRSLAFQTAESALREGEALVAGAAPVFPVCTPATMTSCLNACAGGLCSTPHPNDKPRWDPTSGFNGWQNATALGGAAPAGQYFVEDMGTGPNWQWCQQQTPVAANCLTPRYRITARTNDAGRAATILQSSYHP